jgi:hypothetical protein
MFDNIRNILLSQNIYKNYISETEEMNLVLKKLTLVESIDNLESYVNKSTLLKSFPVPFIEYNEINDQFILRIKKIDKVNENIIELLETDSYTKWVPVIENQYVLEYGVQSITGPSLKKKLPVINKRH